MSTAGPRRVVVGADLRVQVVAPDGREAAVVVADRDGVLRVDVGDVAVLLAALPREPLGAAGLRRLRTLLDGLHERVGPVWDQPLDVAVAGRVVLRRRGGRWRPAARLLVPAAAGVALVTTVAAFALAGVAALARRLLRG